MRYFLPFLLLLLLSTASCRKGSSNKHIHEGVITYEVTYDSTTLTRMDTRLLPSSLIVKFKDNSTLNTIEALSGGVSISIISNRASQQFATLVKVFNKKLYHNEPCGSHYPALYARIPVVATTSPHEPCDYLSYKCYRTTGHFADQPDSEFEIIYTKEININAPNANTPFEEIDGVLLAFNLRVNSLMMQLRAKSVKGSKIPDDTFAVPEEYVSVDIQTITELIYLLQ